MGRWSSTKTNDKAQYLSKRKINFVRSFFRLETMRLSEMSIQLQNHVSRMTMLLLRRLMRSRRFLDSAAYFRPTLKARVYVALRLFG